MIRSAKHLTRFEIVATDGRVGSIDDFYVHDQRWAIRYVVADTGLWVEGRRVLVSPLSITGIDWDGRRLLLSVSHDQVNDIAGNDTHLRSASEVSGYMVRATDGDLGYVDDFLFDDASWLVRYLVVDTDNWWCGKHVLVTPQWIRQISWSERCVSARVRRQRLKSAPEYHRAEHVNRQWEAAYHRHLQQPGYWLDEDGAQSKKEARWYVRDEPERRAPVVERRSRPR